MRRRTKSKSELHDRGRFDAHSYSIVLQVQRAGAIDISFGVTFRSTQNINSSKKGRRAVGRVSRHYEEIKTSLVVGSRRRGR